MSRLVGLCGYAGAGKDTAALGLVDLGWTRIAFADALKAVARDIDWDGNKDVEGRALLQALGVAVRDHVHPDAWVWAVADKVIEAPLGAVITDVRFPNEVEWVVKSGGLLVRVHRPGVVAANDHVSEHAWRDADFDAVIYNDGPPELVQQRLREVVQ